MLPLRARQLFPPRLARGYALLPGGQIPAAKARYVPSSGTYPAGFLLNSAHVGVKASNKTLDDVAVIVSEKPCAAAAVFTTNKFQAAPVVVSREILDARAGEGVRGVVINSGCANAVTGRAGLDDARRMAAVLDRHYGDERASLVMSTGVIGQRLPIDKIAAGIPAALAGTGRTHQHWLNAARAICTTDTFPKLASRQFTLPSSPGITYALAGMAKGAGMIHPNMATLLGVMATDAPVAPAALNRLLADVIGTSFNAISIDGDTSTNDTVALLANGAAGGAEVTTGSSADYAALRDVLDGFAAELAQLVVRDGEGATKFVTIRVEGAPSDEDARRVAAAVGTSPLVKTALYGKDANWGRILCAVGYAPGLGPDAVVPSSTSVSFVPPSSAPSSADEELRLLVRGEPEEVDEARAAAMLEKEDLEILVRLSDDPARTGRATFWTCDFSHEYVTINGDYRT